MAAVLRPFGRSTGPSWPSPSRSCSTKVRGAAPTGREHLLPVVVERLDRLGRRLGDGQAHPGLVRDAHPDVGQFTGGLIPLPAKEKDLFEAGPAGHGHQPLRHRVQVLRGEVGGRPDVDDDPVHVQPLLRRTVRLGVADGVMAGGQRTLDRGQRQDPAVGVAQRCDVTHLRHRDEPLVGRIRVRHAVEQVDLLVRRGESREVELP
jgi:hypothetical protein